MGSPYRQFPFRKQPDNEAPADLIPDNGQVERMNRTIKDATVKRYFYETHDELQTHLRDFLDAYNFARRLKTLKGLTPYEFICKAWTSEPRRFTISPLQKMPGLNSYESLIKACDDEGTKKTLHHLLTREITHANMFMKALDQMGKLDDPFFGNIPPDETVKLVFKPLPG
jgi:hypothetical protein